MAQHLVAYRLIEPGSEWRLHREWFGRSAMADLLGSDFGLAEAHKLYACHDLLLAHKDALFSHLTGRWRDLFNADFDVLLYDLTTTYFEINASDLPEGDKRRHGYSRDKRPDCPQLVIALVVTTEGLPLAYEVLPGNTADSKTLRMFLCKIEQQYGKARHRTTEAEPTFQSLTDRGCNCIPGGRPFPTALDPFTCNRYECAEFARECLALDVRYIGLCCGAAPHHIRAVAEAVGRTVPGSRYSPDMSKHAFFGTDATIPDRYKDRSAEI